jgi:hypothetical protein
MLSLVLLSSVRAQDLLAAEECDIPKFLMGQTSSINPAETVSFDFAEQVALLPKFPMTGAATFGKFAVASDGFGLAMNIGAQHLDIALSQIPEEGLPDKVDTIAFVAAVHADPAGPTLSFALDFTGFQDLKICFSDTIANIAQFMAKMDRRLQVTAGDMPSMPVAPTMTMVGTTQMITFDAPPGEAEYISDGTAVHEVNKVVIALTPPDNIGLNRGYASINLTLTGPDLAFKFMADAVISNMVQPVAALDLPIPGFCESGEVKNLAVKDITGDMEKEVEGEIADMDLENVGDSTARRLLGVDHASKDIAVHVLKKLHSASEMYTAYKQEKQRLVRMAWIEYSVAAVLALALLFSGGAVLRHSFRAKKWDALAVNDEEALREGGVAIENTQ